MNNLNKRAHHNHAERKRRQELKDCYEKAKNVLPMLRNGKASRGQILREATAYINYMTKQDVADQKDIDEMRSLNKALDEQIALLQKGKTPKNMASAALLAEKAKIALAKASNSDGPDYEDSSDSEDDLSKRKRRMK